MSWTNRHVGPAKYAEAEIRAVESWVFFDRLFFGVPKFETYPPKFFLTKSFF